MDSNPELEWFQGDNGVMKAKVNLLTYSPANIKSVLGLMAEIMLDILLLEMELSMPFIQFHVELSHQELSICQAMDALLTLKDYSGNFLNLREKLIIKEECYYQIEHISSHNIKPHKIQLINPNKIQVPPRKELDLHIQPKFKGMDSGLVICQIGKLFLKSMIKWLLFIRRNCQRINSKD